MELCKNTQRKKSSISIPFLLIFYSHSNNFPTRIYELSQMYEWQNVVLPLAMDAHQEILDGA